MTDPSAVSQRVSEQDVNLGATDWRDANGRRWELWRGRMVECPSCGFTFGADHTNAMDENDPDGYSCPLCDLTARHIKAQDAEALLLARVSELEAALVDLREERDGYDVELRRHIGLWETAEARVEAAQEWLPGLETTFAAKPCQHADQGEENTCLNAEEGELEFPDDWCERCYVLVSVRNALAAVLSTEGGQ